MDRSVRNKRLAVGLVVLAVTAAVVVQAVWRPFGADEATLRSTAVDIELGLPDALVESESLARLPRDILRVPLLRDVLTEDLVAYYEQNASRLSLAGTLRRIAYEHDLPISDALLRRVLDEPAQVALWRGTDGRPRYWMVASQRNGLAKLLQGAANVALDDTQLKQVGELTVDGRVALYALAYGYQRTLLFASKGDRLVVLSDPGMLLDAEGVPDGVAAGIVQDLLAGGAGVRRWAAGSLYLDQPPGDGATFKGHRILLDADLLSFGYQPFFPGLQALSFEFGADAAGWRTQALIDPARLPDRWDSAGLWRTLPTDPAACVSLPVDPTAGGAVLDAVLGKDASGVLADAFAGPVGACWYGKSTLSSPLFVARLKRPDAAATLSPVLAAAFAQVVGAYEANAPAANAPATAAAKASPAGTASADSRFPVTTRQGAAGATIWQRAVSARYGSHAADAQSVEVALSAERYFPVTLALAQGYVVFSPDARLVDDALAVLAKTYPAVADSLPSERAARTLLQVTPATLAPLIEREAFDSLPADQEPVFRSAARQHLQPKLRTLAGYPPLSLVLPSSLPGKRGWIAVEWVAGTPAASGGAAAPPR